MPPERQREGKLSYPPLSNSEPSGDRARIRVVAHRANTDGPSPAENTVQAIIAAAEAGADAVELDVRRTVDGQLVLGHDALQWRRQTRVRVPSAIRWSRRRRLPMLDGLDEALACAMGLGLDVKLDVKHAAAVPDVRAHCRAFDRGRVSLWCRSPVQIADPTNHEVFGEVALLARRQDVDGYLTDAIRSRANAVSLDPGLLSAAGVSAAHEQGLTVYAWIVDERGHEDAVGFGVDGLVTDWIARARLA